MLAIARKTPLKPKLRKHYLYSGYTVVVVKGSFIRVLAVTVYNCFQADFLNMLTSVFIENVLLFSYFWVNKNGTWVMTNNQAISSQQKTN